MSQGPKKSKDTTKKKAKENFLTSKSMVNIERPQDDFYETLDIHKEAPLT
jgi:hypothetical protein